MAHPFQEHRQSKVEKSRVAHIVGRADGGSVTAAGTAAQAQKMQDAKAFRGSASTVSGRKNGGRLDRYARGGKVKKGTTVNIMIAGQGGEKQPVPVPVPAPGGPPMPPPPPMAGPPGAMPPGGPPMMPHKNGGRAYAKGGAVKSGRAWEEGKRNGTPVEHDAGKNDTSKINTKPAMLTRKRGGRASGGGVGDSDEVSGGKNSNLSGSKKTLGPFGEDMSSLSRITDKIFAPRKRASGGRAYPLTAGSESGEGRLQKARAQRRS